MPKAIYSLLVTSFSLGTFALKKPDLRQSLTVSRAFVTSVAGSPDTRWVAAGSWDGKVHAYSLLRGNGSLSKSLEMGNSTDGALEMSQTVAFSSNSKWLASGGGISGMGHDTGWRVKMFALPDAGQPVLKYTLSGDKFSFDSLAFSPDSKWLALAKNDGVKVCAVEDDGKLVVKYSLGHGIARSVAFSPDARWLAIGCVDGKARIYRWCTDSEPSLEHTLTEAKRPIEHVAFSADSRFLAAGGWDGRVRFYSLGANGRPQLAYVVVEGDSIEALAFSPDLQWLAVAGNTRVQLYSLGRVAGPRLQHTFKLTQPDREAGYWQTYLTSLSFTGDSTRLLVGSQDGRVRLYALGSAADLDSRGDVPVAMVLV
mmetsp:Transcript_127095/g.353874  ORF Transcript_127095/g.353874 Transcript_127095/m.353874 type:complete len:369 (+) Transcript_127095:48-1154(+)